MNSYNIKYKKSLNNKQIKSAKLPPNNKENIISNKGQKNRDERLVYVLITLGLGDIIPLFEENEISFTDFLLLSKESLREYGLQMYQRNRISNFSTSFNRFAKTYSIYEISEFFAENKQFLFEMSIFNKMIAQYSNMDNKKEYLSDDENNNKNANEKFVNSGRGPKSPKVKRAGTNKKRCFKASKVFKKYLLIKKGVDEFLNKLSKQKEDIENMSHKYNVFIKRINSPNNISNNLNNYDIGNNNNIYWMKKTNTNRITEEKSKTSVNEEKNMEKEYQKLNEKLENLNKIKIDENSLENFNQMKNYILEKKSTLDVDEIVTLQNEIDRITEIFQKKEKLRESLEKHNKNIEESKKMINQLENKFNNGSNREKIEE